MKVSQHILLLALLLFASCDTGRTVVSNFISDDTVRLELSGTRVFSYSDSKCQLAYNEQRRQFRAMTDSMLDYFIVTLDAIPSSSGERVTASIVWTDINGEHTKNNVTLEAKRIKGDIIWLCDDSQQNAAVIRVLK